MLEQLSIRNIALITSLDVTFGRGLNVLSGETGAGKSILIDSLEFVLGKRADKTLIRHGQAGASVSAFFECSDTPSIARTLEAYDIPFDGQILLKRTMSADGKNACYINGVKVTLSMLRACSVALADIYGQHESTALLDSDNHLQVLDNYAKEHLAALLQTQKSQYEQYSDIVERIRRYGSLGDVNRKLDTLRYQLEEIDRAELKDGEEEALLAERKIFRNAETLIGAYADAYRVLAGEDDDNAVVRIAAAQGLLRKIDEYDPDVQALSERLDALKIELRDLCDTLSDKAQSFDFDPRRAEMCEERLQTIRTLKRKYGDSISEISEYADRMRAEYDFLSDGEAALTRLEAQKSDVWNRLYDNSVMLSQSRREAATRLCAAIVKELQELGMKNSDFVVRFDPIPQASEAVGLISENGFDRPIFLFSANAGQPPMDLSKIISGGELSRFLLAVKSIIADMDHIDTMVFDEIDTGISGKIAQVVAEKLARIANGKQVLAVTHLPQLASMADRNYLIEKSVSDGQTQTHLRNLTTSEEIYAEIARLIGGVQGDAYGMLHAQEMKTYADAQKSALRQA